MPTRDDRLAQLLLLAFKDRSNYDLANSLWDLIPCDECPMHPTCAMRLTADPDLSCGDLLEEYLNIGGLKK